MAMTVLSVIFALTIFPGGLFVLLNGWAYEWVDRKLVARLQNRVGPRWFQPSADTLKLLAKEEIAPDGADTRLFDALPIVALAGVLAAALYVPLAGLAPIAPFDGDLIMVVCLLSLLTICTGLAGANTADRFALLGSMRTLTQLFSYEAPFLLALLGPALAAGSWRVSATATYAEGHWLVLTQPLGFLVALLALMGKLELPPFDAPEAETEIVAGALTEYSGRGLALFRLGRSAALVVGLTLIASFYLGGIGDPLAYVAKTGALLVILAGLQALFARLRIDQTAGLWWRIGAILVLVQWLLVILWEGAVR